MADRQTYMDPWTVIGSLNLAAAGNTRNQVFRISGLDFFLVRRFEHFRERARQSRAMERYYGGGLLLREVRDGR